MEQSKIAVKSKGTKRIITKTENKVEPKSAGFLKNASDGLNLTLDNSLTKYANEAFIIEHNKKVERKLSKNKQGF